MSEPMREPSSQPKIEGHNSGEELRVLQQEEGKDLTAELELAHHKLDTVIQALQERIDFLESERARAKGLIERMTSWFKKVDTTVEPQLRKQLSQAALLRNRLGDHLPESGQHLVDQINKLVEIVGQPGALVERPETTEPTIEMERPPFVTIESMGMIKDGWFKGKGSEQYQQHKLGRYGQDYMRTSEAKAISVIADGHTTFLNSYELAVQVGNAAENLLSKPEVQAGDNLESIQRYLVDHLGSLLASSEHLGIEAGTTVLATAYIEHLDALAVIDIGDCEQALAVGDQVIDLKPPLPIETQYNPINKRTFARGTVGVSIVSNKNSIQIHQFDKFKSLFVRMIPLEQYRKLSPDGTVEVWSSSDGLKNNTERSLVDQAQDLGRHGLVEGVRAVHQTLKTASDEWCEKNFTHYQDDANKMAEAKAKRTFMKDDLAVNRMIIPRPREAVASVA